MPEVRFPQYLNKPFQVLFFEPDDMAFMVVGYVIAQKFGGFFWLAMVLLPWGYGRLKHNYPRGLLRHSLYFAGIAPLKRYPHFFQNRFID
jgi:hypothetical protein